MDKNQAIAIMKALGDETRLKIFEMLNEKALCGYHILDKLQITQPTLSHHMKILCECQIVKSEKDWKWIYYSQNKLVLKEFLFYLQNL